MTLVRNHEENGSALGGSFGAPGTPTYDTAALGGTSTVHVTHAGRGASTPTRSLVRHPDELLRWPDALGLVDHLRGDRQRVRRRRRLHPRHRHRPTTYIQNARLQKTHGFIFEVPVDGSATAEPITHAGRFPHESVAWDPRAVRSTSARTTSRSRPGSTSTCRRRTRSGSVACSTAARLYMLKVDGRRPTPTWPCTCRTARASTSSGSRSTSRRSTSADPRPGRRRARPTTRRSAVRQRPGSGQGRRQVLPARGHRLRPRLDLLHLDPGRRGRRPDPAGHVGGFGKGLGQIWGYDTKSQTLHMLFESPSKDVLDFPDNVTTSARGTLIVCEDGDQLQLPARPDPQGRALRHRPEQDRDPAQRRVRRVDVQPGRRDAVRQHPGHASGVSLAIWGPWGRHRGLGNPAYQGVRSSRTANGAGPRGGPE